MTRADRAGAVSEHSIVIAGDCRRHAVSVCRANLVLRAEDEQRRRERSVALRERQHFHPRDRTAGHLEALDARQLRVKHHLPAQQQCSSGFSTQDAAGQGVGKECKRQC